MKMNSRKTSFRKENELGKLNESVRKESHFPEHVLSRCNKNHSRFPGKGIGLHITPYWKMMLLSFFPLTCPRTRRWCDHHHYAWPSFLPHGFRKSSFLQPDWPMRLVRPDSNHRPSPRETSQLTISPVRLPAVAWSLVIKCQTKTCEFGHARAAKQTNAHKEKTTPHISSRHTKRLVCPNRFVCSPGLLVWSPPLLNIPTQE